MSGSRGEKRDGLTHRLEDNHLSASPALQKLVQQVIWYFLGWKITARVLLQPSGFIGRINTRVMATHGFESVPEPAPVLERHTNALDKFLDGFVSVKSSVLCPCEEVMKSVSEFWVTNVNRRGWVKLGKPRVAYRGRV